MLEKNHCIDIATTLYKQCTWWLSPWYFHVSNMFCHPKPYKHYGIHSYSTYIILYIITIFNTRMETQKNHKLLLHRCMFDASNTYSKEYILYECITILCTCGVNIHSHSTIPLSLSCLLVGLCKLTFIL